MIELFKLMDDHPARSHEDPPEELFTDEVWTGARSYRIFPGLYLGAAYHLQRLLIAAEGEDVASRQGVREALALLTLSDAMANSCGFAAGLEGAPAPGQPIRPDLRTASRRGEAATFANDDLTALGVSITDLLPFVLDPTKLSLGDTFGTTALEHHPLLKRDGGVQILSPSGLATAARTHLVFALGHSAARSFYDRDWVRWRTVDLPLAKAVPEFSAEFQKTDPRWERSLSDRALAARLDADKQVHVIVLESNWPANPTSSVPPPLGGGAALRAAIVRYAREMRDQLCDGEGAGLTIVVHNSPGWSLDLGVPEALAPGWFLVPMNAHAFANLLLAPHFRLLDLWKLHAQLADFTAYGHRVHMHQEALTQWSLWEEMGFTFAPPLDDVRGGRYLMDGGNVGPFLARTRALRAARYVRTRDKRHQLVERMVDPEGSPEDLAKPLYYDPVAITAGTLTGVVETPLGPWWVTVGRPTTTAEDRQFLYLLWQATLEWLVLAAATARDRVPFSEEALHLNLLPLPETITDGPTEAEFFFSPTDSEVRILLPAGLMDQMNRADNAAEVQTLTWILAGLLSLCGGDPGQAAVWANEILTDSDLKMIHVTHGADPGHSIDLGGLPLSPFRTLQRSDLAHAPQWMDERLIARSVVSRVEPLKIVEGVPLVNGILKGAVDEHWERCRQRLAALDRRSAINLMMGLIEALHRRRVSDERAARARRVAYGADPELRVRLASSRDHAFRTYRVVVEMGLCVCPLVGGRQAGLSDIDAIAAEVATLVRIAEHSDAVQRRLVDAALTFLPDGSISLPRGDSGGFMEAYGRACAEESISLDEDNYAGLFEPRRTAEETTEPQMADPQDNDFEQVVVAEFGLSLAMILSITVALQEFAAHQLVEAPCLRRSELMSALAAAGTHAGPITPKLFDKYLYNFALRPRSSWETPPDGFALDDIFPWHFERRLSLMTRPLVVIDDTADPHVLFGVRHLMMGVQYALLLLEEGIWPKAKLQSPEARTYVDRQVKRRGDAFEAEVADIFRQAGWAVEPSIPMTRVGAGKAYGDIDVLAISPDGQTWQLIECKWFGAARTPREIAAWMQDFRGHDGDKLDRHLKRVAWVQQNLAAFAKEMGHPIPAQLKGRVATTSPVPLAFVKDLPDAAEVRTRRQLREELGLIAQS